MLYTTTLPELQDLLVQTTEKTLEPSVAFNIHTNVIIAMNSITCPLLLSTAQVLCKKIEDNYLS